MTDPSDGFERRPRIAAAGWDGAMPSPTTRLSPANPPWLANPPSPSSLWTLANWRCSDASPGSPERC